MSHIRLVVIFSVLFLSACGQTTPAMTSTASVCAGATDAGARQKFTFEQIMPCLSTVSQVGTFMTNNVKYDVEYDIRERGGNEYVPARIVYERGIDDADGYAILQCYCLEASNWDAFVIGLSIESSLGSNVCGVRNADGTILVLEGEGRTAGPFGSFAETAKYYIDKGWMQSGGSLRTLKASQLTQITTDFTAPSVLDLPWVFHEY